jgi:hypothetical protein
MYGPQSFVTTTTKVKVSAKTQKKTILNNISLVHCETKTMQHMLCFVMDKDPKKSK